MRELSVADRYPPGLAGAAGGELNESHARVVRPAVVHAQLRGASLGASRAAFVVVAESTFSIESGRERAQRGPLESCSTPAASRVVPRPESSSPQRLGEVAHAEARRRASPRGVVRARGERESRPRALRDLLQGPDLRPELRGRSARVGRVGRDGHDFRGHRAEQRREEVEAGWIDEHDDPRFAPAPCPGGERVPRFHRGGPQVLHPQPRPLGGGVVGEEGVREPTRMRPAPRVHAVHGVYRLEALHRRGRVCAPGGEEGQPARYSCSSPRSSVRLLVLPRFVREQVSLLAGDGGRPPCKSFGVHGTSSQSRRREASPPAYSRWDMLTFTIAVESED